LVGRTSIASKNTVGVDAIAMRDHFGGGVSFGEVWVLSQL
jgi:hypothetical protein